jgi:hypothetical protein
VKSTLAGGMVGALKAVRGAMRRILRKFNAIAIFR